MLYEVITDRDGVMVHGGYEHRIRLGPDTALDSHLRGGVSGGHYYSKGEEYEHDEVEVWLGMRKEVFSLFVITSYSIHYTKLYEQRMGKRP